MLKCQFCDNSEDFFQFDNINKGFWCEECDGYNYIEEIEKRHRFTLILEDKLREKTAFKKSAVKLSKRLSPYRYPGGKSKVIDYLITHLQDFKTKKLVSPFTGGGSFELALLDAGLLEELHINDLDVGVYSLWYTIKHMPNELIYRLKNIRPTHKDFFHARKYIQMDYQGLNIFEAAWFSLLVNRLSYSGIVKANPLGGKNGTVDQLLSRWNPTDLIKRIDRIHKLSEKIEVTNEDALKLIEESYWQDETTIFIDPPYVEKGKDLYHCYYKHEDHIDLSNLLDSLYHGIPGADIVVTYDYNEWLDSIYWFPERKIIGRVYSA